MPTEASREPTAAAALDVLLDADARRDIIADPRKYAQDVGMDVEGKEVVVAVCTEDVLYIPIYQLSESGELSQAELGNVSAAGGASVGSASSVACLCSTASTAASASTHGMQAGTMG